MTSEQKTRLKQLGLELKKVLLDFRGSVTYHFARDRRDVKIEIKECEVAKQL